MQVPVTKLLGTGSIPKDRTAASKWLIRKSIMVQRGKGKGGEFEFVMLSDLPEPERLSYQCRRAEAIGLAGGVQDDAAHLAFQGKPLTVQEAGLRRADILAFVRKHRAAGISWAEIEALAKNSASGKAAAFADFPSQQTVKEWFKRVENVDPVNWAPALAPKYEGGKEHADIPPSSAGGKSCQLPGSARWNVARRNPTLRRP